jgi:hypothetical protein
MQDGPEATLRRGRTPVPVFTNLCGVHGGTTTTWPARAVSTSPATVNSASPLCITNVSS